MTAFADVFNRALQEHRAGHREEAVKLYCQVLQQCPTHVDSLHLLGMLYTQLGEFAKAVTAIEQAIVQNPNVPNFYNSLGNALRSQERLEEAVASYQKALVLKPDYAEAHGNLAIAQKRLHCLEEAILHYEQAVLLDSKLTSAHYNLANCYGEKGLLPQSIAAYRKAVALKPDYADAQQNLAHALLLDGQWVEGWERYEWRFAQRVPVRDYGKPIWQGEPLRGKTLLVQWEQGYGDTFQFVRFLSQLGSLDGKVIFECQPGLLRVLQGCPFVENLIEGSRDGSPPAVDFDWCIPLMSLPRLLKTEIATLPAYPSYLLADPVLVDQWRHRLEDLHGQTSERKIGIVWASNPHVEDRLGRSCALSDFYPLATLPNIRWVSLQKGVDSFSTPGFPVSPLGAELTDFADTAAVIANLDLVISVDTSVAHLAGALGKPTWTLLSHIPNWRWLMGRPDTPWYPSMRLFRQEIPGSWEQVFQEIYHALL